MHAGRRRPTALAPAAILAVLAVALPSARAGAAPPPAPAAVPGSLPPLLSGAVDLGPVAAAAPVDVTLALALRDRAGLEARVAALMAGRPGATELTEPELVARHAPAPATVAAVRSWAAGAGLAVISVSDDRSLVALRGSAARVGGALGVELHRWRAGALVYRAADRPARLPAALAPGVAAILGLSDLGAHKGMSPARRDTAAPALPAVGASMLHAPRGPADFWSFYKAPEGNRGEGQTVGVLAAGQLTIPERDLLQFEQTFGLPRVPWTTVQVGPASLDTVDDTEWDLDTQYTLPAGVFNDVVVGFQGLWASTPGWDYTTGRGTPNISALLDALRP